MSDDRKRTPIVRAPLFPTYSGLKSAILTFDGESVEKIRETIGAIWNLTGTPQNPVDWTDPDTWIDQRLVGTSREIAHKIWEGSGKKLNPRHIYGCYLFINRLHLLKRVGEQYILEERGRRFLADDPTILQELDAAEGLPKVLSLVAERSPCKRGEILPAWSDYLKLVSLFSKPSTFADTLSRRLVNLIERGLISRDGNSYSITGEGIIWLKGFSSAPSMSNSVIAVPSTKRTTVAEAAHAYNEEQLVQLRQRLMNLAPVQFEHFVKALLEAMDYEDVQVTKFSGDKGVDVVARVQFGITEITEVVQVKRTEGTIHRPKVDELRGALPYHKAIRGTIISLGDFAKGAQDGALYVGAAPISLIDGKRLLDLCIKHEVGVKRRPVEIYEIDETFFSDKFGSSDEEVAVESEGSEAP